MTTTIRFAATVAVIFLSFTAGQPANANPVNDTCKENAGNKDIDTLSAQFVPGASSWGDAIEVEMLLCGAPRQPHQIPRAF